MVATTFYWKRQKHLEFRILMRGSSLSNAQHEHWHIVEFSATSNAESKAPSSSLQLNTQIFSSLFSRVAVSLRIDSIMNELSPDIENIITLRCSY